MKKIKILALPLGNYGLASSRTRVYEIFPRLDKNKIQSKICKGAGLGFRGRELEFIANAPFYDILFIQKSISRRVLACAKLMKKLGKKIVYDLDDPSYMVWKECDEFTNISDLVTVENEFNKKHCLKINPKVKVEIILGPIDFAHYSKSKKYRKKHDSVNIGWVGSANTSKNIHLIAKGIDDAAKSAKGVGKKVKLIIIGGVPERVNYEFKFAEVEYRQWGLDKELKDLADIDIGIMPIKNDTENKGKGGYKLLQYMAASIPCVATRVGVNKDLIEDDKNGLLIKENNSSQEWAKKLFLMIKDEKFRNRAGKIGQARVKKYDIVPYCEKFEQVLLDLS
ncbi:MAG: glycosyltransferase family 4 protein [archaeon]|jgi:glycosyltransferase involved in cell wall biosynthesis